MILRSCLNDDLVSDAILMSDYMSLYKQKPKRLSFRSVSHDEMKKCYERLIENQLSTQNECYHYGRVEYYYDDEICYQILIYNANHSYPKRWILKEKELYEKKLTR